MHKQVRLFVVALAAAAAAAAGAAPSPDQAEKFKRELRQVVDQAAVNVDTMPKRRAHQAKLQELEQRAGRLFGNAQDPAFGSCVKAAGMLNTAWTNQMVMATRPAEPKEVALLSKASFDAGAQYLACTEAIEALSPAMPKECLVVVDLTPGAKIPPRPAHCPKL